MLSEIDRSKRGARRAAAVIGCVLYDVNKTSRRKELFAVIGKSYNEVALVRLLEQMDVNASLPGKWYLLRHKIRSIGTGFQFPPPFQIDVSRLIIKDHFAFSILLTKHPERLAGRIHKHDLEKIVSLLQSVNTISKDSKDKYCGIW